MKVLGWLLKAAVFLLIFALALQNKNAVRVHGLFGVYWEAPLVLVLLLVLLVGVLLGMAVMAQMWWRSSRRAHRSTEARTTPATDTATPQDPPHGI